MKFEILHDSMAAVRLTAAEVRAMHSGNLVPMLYSPGGMGPEKPELPDRASSMQPATIRFGGPCFVDAQTKLVDCLAQFRTALRSAVARLAAEDARSRAYVWKPWPQSEED
jgi:hypothetical protein